MKRALVTLAIGDRYLGWWRQYAEAGWRQYAERFGLDLIVITESLDVSPRAEARSPAWQKCIIPRQAWAQEYDRMLWLDSDIVINNANAEDLLAAVPDDKVGVLTGESLPPFVTQSWREVYKARYHTSFGLPSDFEMGMNTGVLAYSPRHVAPLFGRVYDEYEDRGENTWHYEQRPLSWNIFDAKLDHPIDSRYNYGWSRDVHQHYPFVLEDRPNREELLRLCLAVSFGRACFLHFCGRHAEMQYLG